MTEHSMSSAPICAAALWTRTFFAACGIVQSRDITIEVVRRVMHPLGLPVVATFDATTWRIRISTEDVTRSLILSTSVYSTLPIRDLYESLVVHEIAHAIFREHSGQRRLPTTAHEYIAYAVQIASMPEGTRDLFLAAFPLQTPRSLDRFNDIYLAAGPLRFAANAYRHLFRDSQHCATIRAIASGVMEFPMPIE